MKEINSAILYLDNEQIVILDLPEVRVNAGEIYIDCYIDKSFFEGDVKNVFPGKSNKLDNKLFSIEAISSHGSRINFNQVFLQAQSYPSFKFSFLCIDYTTEYQHQGSHDEIVQSKLKSLEIEGVQMKFDKVTEKKRIRSMFGKDQSRTLSFDLDNSEIVFNYSNSKRSFNLEIGLINNSEKDNTISVVFYQEKLIDFRIYNKIKHSIKYFVSYLCGNNIVIRNEHFQSERQSFTKTYSQSELSENNVNHFLPIHDIQFKRKKITQQYISTFSNYLKLDKWLNLSEIIYLINQSKQVNIESSFFIILIAIEKLSNSLINSELVDKTRKPIISEEIFKLLKPELIKSFDEIFKGKVPKKQLDSLRSKVGSINQRNKTDNKIDLLLEFCEIKRTDEIDLLFPQLRNLAIHQGEISYNKNESSKNYHTLFILVNNIICNLIQYQGLRFIENKDGTNYVATKTDFKLDLELL